MSSQIPENKMGSAIELLSCLELLMRALVRGSSYFVWSQFEGPLLKVCIYVVYCVCYTSFRAFNGMLVCSMNFL